MRSKELMAHGLTDLRRQRGRFGALTRAFELAVGTPEQHAEYEREVIQVAAKEAEAAYDEPPKASVRKRLIPNWAWKIRLRGGQNR